MASPDMGAILDEEFVATMKTVEQYIGDLSKHDKIRMENWAKRLCEVYSNETFQRNRNAYARLMLLCVKSGQWEPPMDKHPSANGPLPLLPQSLLIKIRKGNLGSENQAIFLTSTKNDAVDPKRRLEREVERLTLENRRLRLEVRKGLAREKTLQARIKSREEAILTANPRLFDLLDEDTSPSAGDLGKSRGKQEDREGAHVRDLFLRAPQSFVGLPGCNPARSSSATVADDQAGRRASEGRRPQLAGYSSAARDLESAKHAMQERQMNLRQSLTGSYGDPRRLADPVSDSEDYLMDRYDKMKLERLTGSHEAIEDISAYRAKDSRGVKKHDQAGPLQTQNSQGRVERPASLDNPPSPSDTKAFFKYLDEFSAWTNELLNDEAR